MKRCNAAKPCHALFGAAVREGIWIYMPSGHLLQPVISHGGSRAKSGLDIALFEQTTLLGGMRPNPGKTISLQFHLYG